MHALAALAIVLSTTVAIADPTARDPRAAQLTTTAIRAALHGDCATARTLGERVKELDPDYYAAAFATSPVIADCRQGVRRDTDRIEAPPPPPAAAPARPSSFAFPLQRRFTFEIAIGAGAVTGNDGSYAFGGPNIGVGAFVSTRLALSARSAASIVLGGIVHTIGPHVQFWLDDKIWVGGGAGLGTIIGCGVSCSASGGLGLDVRVGFAVRGRRRSGAALSLEVTEYWRPETRNRGSDSLQTVSLMLGYQSL